MFICVEHFNKHKSEFHNKDASFRDILGEFVTYDLDTKTCMKLNYQSAIGKVKSLSLNRRSAKVLSGNWKIPQHQTCS